MLDFSKFVGAFAGHARGNRPPQTYFGKWEWNRNEAPLVYVVVADGGCAMRRAEPSQLGMPPPSTSTYIYEIYTVASGSTLTQNMLVQRAVGNTSASTVSVASTDVLGVTVSAPGSTVYVARYGLVQCYVDPSGAGASTIGHLATIGTGYLGYCADSGQTAVSGLPTGTHVAGYFLTSASAGALAWVELTPGLTGTGVVNTAVAATSFSTSSNASVGGTLYAAGSIYAGSNSTAAGGVHVLDTQGHDLGWAAPSAGGTYSALIELPSTGPFWLGSFASGWSLTLTSGSASYGTGAHTCTISFTSGGTTGGGGSGATAIVTLGSSVSGATLLNSSNATIFVGNPGSGYTAAPTAATIGTLSGGSCTGAGSFAGAQMVTDQVLTATGIDSTNGNILTSWESSVPNPIVTAGSGGVSANYLVTKDTSNPTLYVTASGGSCGDGVASATAAAGSTFELYSTPGQILTMMTDGSVTAGHLVLASTGTGTAGFITDSGQTARGNLPSTVCIVGVAQASATGSGQSIPVLYDGSGVYGTYISFYGIGGISGTGQSQTITAISPAPNVPALNPGLTVSWLPSAANTGSGPTLAVTGLTAKTITKCGTNPLAAGDLSTSTLAVAVYDGANFELQNPQNGCGVTHENAITTITSNYSVGATDTYIPCSSGSGSVTITLPVATGSGREIVVKKVDSGTGSCVPAGSGSDTIDGAGSYAISSQYASIRLIDRASGTWDRLTLNQLAGDVSGTSVANTVSKVNGTSLAGLNTGILRNTTGTGVPSSSELSGDASTTGSNMVTVTGVNGLAVAASIPLVHTNSTKQLVNATPHHLSNLIGCADAGSSSTTYSCTMPVAFTPTAGDMVLFSPHTTNSGSSTVQVSSQSSGVAIKKPSGGSLVNVSASDLLGGNWYIIVYDGSVWELISITGNGN